MSFISYSQNFEDVMLWRALKHVENGTYVDVGAQHPIVDSVSKAFYEHGWRGIHIEPVLEFAELLRADRPDETILQVALADQEGTLELNVIANTGLSTAVGQYAQTHFDERGFEHKRVQVPVLTLKSALKGLIGKEVHWLKIDVEGFEEKVLLGWDSEILRPWIMVIEATIPNSTETDYDSWDPIVTAAGYDYVYFDGLNRYYVAKEHPELVASFSAPPNVFDEVVLSGQASWGLVSLTMQQNNAVLRQLQSRFDEEQFKLEDESHRLRQIEVELEQSRERERQAAAEWHFTKERLEELRVYSQQGWDTLHLTYASTSWKVTRPLRYAVRAARKLKSLSRKGAGWSFRRTKGVAIRSVMSTMRKILSPSVRSAIFRRISKYPRLKNTLRALAARAQILPINSSQNHGVSTRGQGLDGATVESLSPRARHIFKRLQKAQEGRNF